MSSFVFSVAKSVGEEKAKVLRTAKEEAALAAEQEFLFIAGACLRREGDEKGKSAAGPALWLGVKGRRLTAVEKALLLQGYSRTPADDTEGGRRHNIDEIRRPDFKDYRHGAEKRVWYWLTDVSGIEKDVVKAMIAEAKDALSNPIGNLALALLGQVGEETEEAESEEAEIEGIITG